MHAPIRTEFVVRNRTVGNVEVLMSDDNRFVSVMIKPTVVYEFSDCLETLVKQFKVDYYF